MRCWDRDVGIALDLHMKVDQRYHTPYVLLAQGPWLKCDDGLADSVNLDHFTTVLRVIRAPCRLTGEGPSDWRMNLFPRMFLRIEQIKIN